MGLLFPPPFALRVWLPVVCCPLVAEPCHDQLRWGLPSSWDLGWVHLTWAVGLGVQDMVHGGQRVCSQSNPGVGAGLHIGCNSLCAHSLVCIHPSEFSVCIQGFEPAEPGLGHTLPGQRLGLPLGRMGRGCGPAWECNPAAGIMADSDLGLPVQDFDRLLEALQAALAKDPGTGFVFSCLSGQGRTTTAMVVAVLVFWHIQVRAASCVRTGICPGRVGVSPWGPGPWWVDGGRALSGQPWAGPRSGLWASGEVLPAQQLSSLRASPRWARRSS